MARFDSLRGSSAAKAAQVAAEAKRSRFTPQIKWEDGERKYLQFLIPFEDRLTAPMHQFVRVGRDSNTKSGFRYADFLLAPDDDGNAARDLIAQRFGVEPTVRTISVAMEMEPIIETVEVKGKKRKKVTGFEPKMREWTDKDDEVHESPEVGLVIMSHNNFWRFFEDFEEEEGPVDEHVFSVKRLGGGTDTTYNVNSAGDPIEIDFDEDDLLDVDEWLEEVADPERMAALIEPLPDDWVVNQYASRGKDDRSKKKSSRLGKAAKSAPADDVDEEHDEDDAGSEGETSTGKQPASRKARFANLRKDMAAKS